MKWGVPVLISLIEPNQQNTDFLYRMTWSLLLVSGPRTVIRGLFSWLWTDTMNISDFISQAFENKSGVFHLVDCSFSKETRWRALGPKQRFGDEFVRWVSSAKTLIKFYGAFLKVPWGFSEECPVGRGWSLDIQIFNLVVPKLGQRKWQKYDIKQSVEWLLSPMELSHFCSMRAGLFHFIFYSGVTWREKTRKNSVYTRNKYLSSCENFSSLFH